MSVSKEKEYIPTHLHEEDSLGHMSFASQMNQEFYEHEQRRKLDKKGEFGHFNPFGFGSVFDLFR